MGLGLADIGFAQKTELESELKYDDEPGLAPDFFGLKFAISILHH
jgi:hypothetical protein